MHMYTYRKKIKIFECLFSAISKIKKAKSKKIEGIHEYESIHEYVLEENRKCESRSVLEQQTASDLP